MYKYIWKSVVRGNKAAFKILSKNIETVHVRICSKTLNNY